MLALLLKSSIVLVVLWSFYKLFLEKESFFAANRMYLLGGIFLFFILPFISLPELLEEQGLVSVMIEEADHRAASLPEIASEVEDEFLSQTNSEPLSKDSLVENPPAKQQKKGWPYWLFFIYYFGVIIFFLNLITQLISLLFRIIKNNDLVEDVDCSIINTPIAKEPCSFFNFIFIDPERYDYPTYEQIIAHEKIHVRKWHTIDLLLAEIAVAILWFNPLIWLFRKEIEKNIEYQTDDLLLREQNIEKNRYQMNLVKVSANSKPLTITSNYNQSLIKKRILKMNAKKSNPHAYWKYAFIAPVLFLLLLFINKPSAAFAQTITYESAPEQVDLQQDADDTGEYHAQDDESPDHGLVDADCKELLKAIRAEDIAKVKELLKTVEPDCIDHNPDYEVVVVGSRRYHMQHVRTPLVAAARAGSLEIGKLLINAKADIEFHAEGDPSPLMAAAESGNLDFVKYLHSLGAKINVEVHGEGTALLAAARKGRLEIVKYLLAQGADINAQVPEEGTALLVAARNGHKETVEYLLAKGADINAQVPGEGTALLAAARNGRIATVEHLLAKGADINAKVPGEGTALLAAARNGRIETVEHLIAKGADINAQVPGEGTALLAAARNGRKETVEHLIAKGADINAKVPGEGTALLAAARNGRKETVEHLIAKGADINAQVPGEGTALLAAARNGHIQMVKYLISQGAEVDAAVPGEGTALGGAVKNGHYELAKILLENGADPYQTTPGNEYPMFHARMAKDKAMIDLLEKYKKED